MTSAHYHIRLSTLLVIVGLTIGLAACTGRLNTRGNLVDPAKLAKIKVGQQTRADVSEILGSPSSVAAFDKETWYYISKRTETTAFLEPKLRGRKVVVLRFNKKGVVDEIKILGPADGKDITPVKRETPTVGSKLGFFEQLLGNLGRFSK